MTRSEAAVAPKKARSGAKLRTSLISAGRGVAEVTEFELLKNA